MISTRVVLLLIGMASFDSLAYEQATHGFLTRLAFEASAFSASSGTSVSLVQTLGLDIYAPLGEREEYFELLNTAAGTTPLTHRAQLYEKRILTDLKITESQSAIMVWLMYGAIREDDNPNEDPATPQDVAPGLRRPLNHFFDPYLNRPLTFPGLFALDDDVHTNPDWAIGSAHSFVNPNLQERPRRNNFTVFDARESMLRALTLMTYDGTSYFDISAGADKATKQAWRQAYWATALRALGNVLHLNQDMAQPQHTRNDRHSGQACAGDTLCLGGHTSVYEKYINARARLEHTFSSGAPFHAAVDVPIHSLTLGAYPIPAFANYTDYWSTAPGNHSVPGKGLADYSNRGFFTTGTNVGSSEYPLPSNFAADYVIRSLVPTRWDGTPASDATPVHVYYGAVSDQWQQTSTSDVPLTAYSLWNQFLTAQSSTPSYSLNRLHYDAMANLLLPRAVAYSAGLINYFFRGRLDISLPDEGVFALADHATTKGFTKVRAKVRNATPTFVDPSGASQSQNMSGGDFFAVIRYHTDRKYVTTLDTIVGAAPCNQYSSVVDPENLGASTECREGVEQIVVSRPIHGQLLDANQQVLLEFDFTDSPVPYGMTDVVLQVVYRGQLGAEAQGIAVGTVDVSEPTYFTYQNASDYIHLGDNVYTRGEVDSDVNLLALVQPQYCVDYQQAPPRLVAGCLDQFALDLTVSFGDLAKPIAKVVELPNRRFIRFVYLTVADEGFNPPIVKKAARTVRVIARPHESTEKALLYQEGTCLPLDPFDIPPRHSQMTVVSSTQIGYRVDQLDKLRGVNGWYNVSCVVNGDNATPGTPDDRAQVMTPLTPLSEEVEPFAVTIMPEYL